MKQTLHSAPGHKGSLLRNKDDTVEDLASREFLGGVQRAIIGSTDEGIMQFHGRFFGFDHGVGHPPSASGRRKST